MEQQPKPVDVSRLKSILGNAKKVMEKVENNDYKTGHIDPKALTEDGVRQLQAEGVVRPQVTQAATKNVDYTNEQVINSNLPPAIKKAMMEKHIPKPTGLNHTFTLDDVAELADKPMGPPKTPKTQPKVITENRNNSDLITISKSELDAMINAKLLEFLTKSYNKTLTEETIARTINMLIKEGKITVNKKK